MLPSFILTSKPFLTFSAEDKEEKEKEKEPYFTGSPKPVWDEGDGKPAPKITHVLDCEAGETCKAVVDVG